VTAGSGLGGAVLALGEAGDDAKQCGFTAARGTEQRDQCPRRHVQIDVFDGGEFAELLGNAAQSDAHAVFLRVR